MSPSTRRKSRPHRSRAVPAVIAGAVVLIGIAFVLPASAAGRRIVPTFVSVQVDALHISRPSEFVFVKARVENSTSCALRVMLPSYLRTHVPGRWRSCTSGSFTDRIRLRRSTTASADIVEFRLLARASSGAVAARRLTVNLRPHDSVGRNSSRASDASGITTLAAADQQSTAWAGYVSTSSSRTTSVAATWTVPTVACGSSTTWLGSWLGVDGAEVAGPGTKVLFQAGVYSYCVDGEQENEAWWEEYPGPANPLGAVGSGDAISAAVWNTGDGWMWSVTDSTSGTSYRSSQPVDYSGPAGTAEWIVEDPGTPSEPFVAGFSPITFTNMAMSTTKGASFTHGTVWQMVQNGDALATPVQSSAFVASQRTLTVRSGGPPF